LLVVIALSACKKDPPVEEPENTGSGAAEERIDDGMPQELVDLVEVYVQAFEGVARAVVKSQSCDELAVDLQAALDQAQPAMEALTPHQEEVTGIYKVQVNNRFGIRIDDAFATIGEGIEPCEDDPRIQGHLKNLGLQ
jgi:hypothetical protein